MMAVWTLSKAIVSKGEGPFVTLSPKIWISVKLKGPYGYQYVVSWETSQISFDNSLCVSKKREIHFQWKSFSSSFFLMRNPNLRNTISTRFLKASFQMTWQ